MLYISQESRHYHKDTCPLCVLKVTTKCKRFWNCCITQMKHQKSFSTIWEALSFQNSCYHFRYEHVYIKLCMEGNIYENAHRHLMRYFSSIDTPESFTSQRFKQLTMSDEVVSGGTPSYSASLLNTVCRIYSNGSKCANCELQILQIGVQITCPFNQNRMTMIYVSKWHYV